MKNILFVSYGGGHVQGLLPVYEKLFLEKGFNCNFLALTTAYQQVKNKNLPCIGFKDLVVENDYALEVGKKLIGVEHNHSMVSYEESIAYMGLSYCDLLEKVGKNKAKELYAKYGRQAFYPLNTLRKLLEKEAPDLVITTNSPRAERAAVDAAKDLGIPSLCLVDLFALQEISWIGQPGFANKVCVISEYIKEKMLAAGRKPGEIVVTGNPAFDELSKYQNPECVRLFREKKGWSLEDKIVLWASNVEPEMHPYTSQKGDALLPLKVEEMLKKMVDADPSIKLVIRPHPNDSRLPFTDSDRIELSSQKDDLNQLLTAVDCVVVLASTVGMQAALLRKPLVNIKLSIFSKNAPYDEMRLSTGVDDLNDLNEVIIQALNEKPRNSTLTTIGSATDNIISVIKDLL
ncbi:CDP-glycerol glycerophosphotransferase family protein [Endozoicomonas sp. 4G]|uniref:CDP-glycerol glycerophosphotransferase family protein n=1 Tax=Endozoicomonas sp. 4G TaxID=2872754 RepID=UPI00207900C9|nr:CDP-glycerol glycerophosphotransferase family protein [Endozoicomonas sp. 4G]